MHRPAGRPWVIAHRGASHAMRENTLPAFREAYARGADAVELDVRRTADGALVVHHDAAIPGAGPIVETGRADLAAAAPWVPDLADALAACAGMWVNVEVKNSPSDPDWDDTHRAARMTADVLAATGTADRCLVSSFDPGTIAAAAAALPGLRTGWLAGLAVDPLQAAEAASAAGHTAVHPHAGTLAGAAAAEVSEAAHRMGLWVIAWTVDDPAEIVRLAGAGVDGVITNRPATARSALEHRHGDGG